MTMDSRYTRLVLDLGGKHQSFTTKYNDTWGKYSKFAFSAATLVPSKVTLEKEKSSL